MTNGQKNHVAVPTKNISDLGHTTAKALLASVPLIGGVAAEFFNYLVTPSIEQRRDAWLESILRGFASLEERFAEFEIGEVFQDDRFISAFLQATRYASLNHEAENLEALRNAVLNAAIPVPHDEIKQKMFIEWAGQLTAWHLRILRLFEKYQVQIPHLDLDDPKWRQNIATKRLADLIEEKHPETQGNYHLYMQVISDLHSRNLITNLLPERKMTTRIAHEPELSSIGRQFLKFITSPIADVSKEITDEHKAE